MGETVRGLSYRSATTVMSSTLWVTGHMVFRGRATREPSHGSHGKRVYLWTNSVWDPRGPARSIYSAPTVQECVQEWKHKGCESRFRPSHPRRTKLRCLR